MTEVTRNSSTSSTNILPTVSSSLSSLNTKVQEVAKSLLTGVKAVYNSSFILPIAARVVIVLTAALILGYLGLTPPGWISVAVAATTLAIGLLIRPKQTIAELSSIKKLIFGGDSWSQPPSTESDSFLQKISTGTSPNKLGFKTFEKKEEGSSPVSLFIGEEWETKPKGPFIPYSTSDLKNEGIESHRIFSKNKTPLSTDQLEEAAYIINQAVSAGKDIYIHNRSDPRLSTMAIAAYLIKYEGKSIEEAINATASRKSKTFKAEMKTELADFESKLVKIDLNKETDKTDESAILKELQSLIDRGQKINIVIDGQSKTLAHIIKDSYFQNIPNHVLLSLTETFPAKAREFLVAKDNKESDLSESPIFSKSITLTKLDNTYELQGNFSEIYLEKDESKKLKSISHINYSATIPETLTQDNASVILRVDKTPASKLELFLCEKDIEFQKTLEKKTLDVQTRIKTKLEMTSDEHATISVNLGRAISNFLSKRTDFNREDKLLAKDFLDNIQNKPGNTKEVDKQALIDYLSTPTQENPNTEKYATAADKIFGYRNKTIFTANPNDLVILNKPTKSDVCSRINDDLGALQVKIIANGKTTDLKKNKSETSSIEDQSSNIKDQLDPLNIPQHIRPFLHQGSLVLLKEIFQENSGLTELNIIPDRIKEKPYELILENQNNNWKVTIDCNMKYTSSDFEDQTKPIAFAKWHCEAFIPDQMANTSGIQLHFTATPIDDPNSVKA